MGASIDAIARYRRAPCQMAILDQARRQRTIALNDAPFLRAPQYRHNRPKPSAKVWAHSNHTFGRTHAVHLVG